MAPLSDAKACEYWREPVEDKGGELRWVIYESDPCICTSLDVGGINRMDPQRLPDHYYSHCPLITEDTQQIQAWFGCKT